MNRKLTVAIVAAFLLSAIGSGAYVATSDREVCKTPWALLNSDYGSAMTALEKYVAVNLSPATLGKKPDKDVSVIWMAGSVPLPSLEAGRFEFRMEIGWGYSTIFGDIITSTPVRYDVVLAQDCAGGDWRLVSIKSAPTVKSGPPVRRPTAHGVHDEGSR